MIFLFLSAVTVVGSGMVILLTMAVPLWLAVPVGVVLGVLLVAGFIFTMGNDLMDVIMGSIILLVLAGMLFPVFSQARRRHGHRHRAWVASPHTGTTRTEVHRH